MDFVLLISQRLYTNVVATKGVQDLPKQKGFVSHMVRLSSENFAVLTGAKTKPSDEEFVRSTELTMILFLLGKRLLHNRTTILRCQLNRLFAHCKQVSSSGKYCRPNKESLRWGVEEAYARAVSVDRISGIGPLSYPSRWTE